MQDLKCEKAINYKLKNKHKENFKEAKGSSLNIFVRTQFLIELKKVILLDCIILKKIRKQELNLRTANYYIYSLPTLTAQSLLQKGLKKYQKPQKQNTLFLNKSFSKKNELNKTYLHNIRKKATNTSRNP